MWMNVWITDWALAQMEPGAVRHSDPHVKPKMFHLMT